MVVVDLVGAAAVDVIVAVVVSCVDVVGGSAEICAEGPVGTSHDDTIGFPARCVVAVNTLGVVYGLTLNINLILSSSLPQCATHNRYSNGILVSSPLCRTRILE